MTFTFGAVQQQTGPRVPLTQEEKEAQKDQDKLKTTHHDQDEVL